MREKKDLRKSLDNEVVKLMAFIWHPIAFVSFFFVKLYSLIFVFICFSNVGWGSSTSTFFGYFASVFFTTYLFVSSAYKRFLSFQNIRRPSSKAVCCILKSSSEINHAYHADICVTHFFYREAKRSIGIFFTIKVWRTESIIHIQIKTTSFNSNRHISKKLRACLRNQKRVWRRLLDLTLKQHLLVISWIIWKVLGKIFHYSKYFNKFNLIHFIHNFIVGLED